MSLGELFVDCERPFRGRACTRVRVLGLQQHVAAQYREGVGQTRPRLGEHRVQIERLLEVVARLLQGRAIALVPEMAALQIELVRGRIFRSPFRKATAFVIVAPHGQFVGDAPCDCAQCVLQLGQRNLLPCRPKRLAACDVQELKRGSDAVTGSADTALHDRLCAELPPDLHGFLAASADRHC